MALLVAFDADDELRARDRVQDPVGINWQSRISSMPPDGKQNSPWARKPAKMGDSSILREWLKLGTVKQRSS